MPDSVVGDTLSPKQILPLVEFFQRLPVRLGFFRYQVRVLKSYRGNRRSSWPERAGYRERSPVPTGCSFIFNQKVWQMAVFIEQN